MDRTGLGDALLAPDAWPGCSFAYDVIERPGNELAIGIVATIDPAAASLARATWNRICEQVHDPRIHIVATCSLYGDADSVGAWPTIGRTATLRNQFRSLVDRVHAAAAGVAPAPVSVAIILPLDSRRIATRGSDVFPLVVALTLSRGAVADAPGEIVVVPLPPRVSAAFALLDWARIAESRLADFDGAEGRLRLARRVSPTDPAEPADLAEEAAPDLWAVRMSATAGIAFGGRNAEIKPVLWTMRPCASVPQRGDVDVVIWDERLRPSRERKVFSGIDVDHLLNEVLDHLDFVTQATHVAMIARTDPAAATRLAAAKAAVAHALGGRLMPIFADQRGQGAPEEARLVFEEALRARLGDATQTTAVAQVPMIVSAAGTSAVDGVAAPRLRGHLLDGGSDHDLSALAWPSLPLDQTGTSERWLTFLVTAATPDRRLDLSLAPRWIVDRIDHPAGPLHFLGIGQDEAAGLPLGDLSVPIASRGLPAPPVLSQDATGEEIAAAFDASGPIEELVRAAMRWRLTLAIERGVGVAQDTLWIAATFDLPAVQLPDEPTDAAPLTPLATALLKARAGLACVAPLLASGLGEGGGLTAIVTALVSDVAAALAAGEPPSPMGAARSEAARTLWMLRGAPDADGQHRLLARATDASGPVTPRFPQINGLAPLGPPLPVPPGEAPDAHDWVACAYAFPDREASAPLTLTIGSLDLRSERTAFASAYVTRNVRPDAMLDPLLARRMPEHGFGPVAQPRIRIDQPLAAQADGRSMTAMLLAMLMPMRDIPLARGEEASIRLAFVFIHPLDAGGAAIPVTTPVLLMPHFPPHDAEEAADVLCARLADWSRASDLPHEGGAFSVNLALFVGRNVDIAREPILTIDRLDLPLPPGWPGPADG